MYAGCMKVPQSCKYHTILYKICELLSSWGAPEPVMIYINKQMPTRFGSWFLSSWHKLERYLGRENRHWKFPPSAHPAGMSAWHFLGCLMCASSVHCGRYLPWDGIFGSYRKGSWTWPWAIQSVAFLRGLSFSSYRAFPQWWIETYEM